MFTCTKNELRELIMGASKFAVLFGEPKITECPDGLIVDGWLAIDKWSKVTALPDNLLCINGELDISGNSNFKHLPDNLTVSGNLDLRGCTGLTELPDNLTVGGDLDIRRCAGITMLPRDATIGGRVFWGDDWWG